MTVKELMIRLSNYEEEYEINITLDARHGVSDSLDLSSFSVYKNDETKTVYIDIW